MPSTTLLVEGDAYLHRLSRYLHLNPLHTREAGKWTLPQKRQWLRAYRWSSYRGYIDERTSDSLVDQGPILAMMAGPKGDRRREYRRFVESGLTRDDVELQELLVQVPRGIGTQTFRKRVDDEYRRLKETQGSEEDVSFRREATVGDASGIIAIVARHFGDSPQDMRRRMRGSWARPVAAWMLCKHAGLTQRAAGALLGYGTGSAVSHQLTRVRMCRLDDPALMESLKQIEHGILDLDRGEKA